MTPRFLIFKAVCTSTKWSNYTFQTWISFTKVRRGLQLNSTQLLRFILQLFVVKHLEAFRVDCSFIYFSASTLPEEISLFHCNVREKFTKHRPAKSQHSITIFFSFPDFSWHNLYICFQRQLSAYPASHVSITFRLDKHPFPFNSKETEQSK